MAKKKDLLHLSLIGIGALFLFNPNINIVDPLPDFIGYWLMALGMGAIAYLSDKLWAAKKNLVYLALLTAAKTLVCLAIPTSTDTFTVLMAFCFAVAEAILFLPFASAFFEGLGSLGLRFGSESVFTLPHTKKSLKKLLALSKKIADETDTKKIVSLSKKAEKLQKKRSSSRLKTLTVAAFIIKALGSVIPTLPYLKLYGDTLFVTEGIIDWSNYIGVFYILAWGAGFGIGIPWVIRFRRYIKGLCKDTVLTCALSHKYETEILCDTGSLIAARMKKVFMLFSVAAILTVYFPIDYVNALPNFFCAFCVIAMLIYLYPEGKGLCVAGICTCSVWSVLSFVVLLLQSDYKAMNYDPPAAVAFGGEGRGMADELYLRIEVVSFAESVFFLASALFFAFAFMKAIKAHMAAMPPRQDGLPREFSEMIKCLIPVWIMGAVVVVLSFGIIFVTKYITGIWLLYFVYVAVFFAFVLIANMKLSERIYLPLKRKF